MGMCSRATKLVTLLMALMLIATACGSNEEASESEEPGSATEAASTEPETDTAATEPEETEVEETVTTEPEDTGVSDLEPLDNEKVVVGYVGISKFAALYVAEESGYFDRYGLDVELQKVATGNDIALLMDEGQVDVGAIAITSGVFNSWNDGSELTLFLPAATEPFEGSQTQLLVRSDLAAEIATLDDLLGRTVGIEGGPGSGAEYLLAKVLERGGYTLADVTVETLGRGEASLALEGGLVEAAIAGSPASVAIAAAGTGEALEWGRDFVPGQMTVGYVASPEFLTARPDVAERMALAMALATADLLQGDDRTSTDVVNAVAKYTEKQPEDVKDLPSLFFNPEMVIPVDGFEDVQRVHLANGRLAYDEPFDISSRINVDFAAGAASLASQLTSN